MGATPIGKRCRRAGAALAGLLLFALIQVGHTSDATTITNPGAFLDQTESPRIKDHRLFASRLAQIHREAPPLTTAEQWHLRYLDALESSLDGKFAAAEKPLREVIAQSVDPMLAIKASALLMNNLAVSHRYQEAFQLAEQLTIELPHIQDAALRLQVLSYLSQILNLAGQTDLAIRYARMMEASADSDTSMCFARARLAAALFSADRLTSSSSELKQAISTCKAAQQPIMTATMQLTRSTIELDEHQATKALALLDRIAPAIRLNHYYPHTLSAQVQRAQAYEQLGRDDDARKAALAALDMAAPHEVNNYLKDAYDLLYRITKRQGDTVAALSYFEHYVAQNKRSLDDAAAQALAYQTVQQQVLTRQLETEELSKQNKILRLQQSLDAKAVETSRLYISLLLIILATIVFWVLRLKRSHFRLRQLATHDGLTGIYNYQHFISEADRTLAQLAKKLGPACLVSLDLDHFKQVNDTHGHAMGDAVLRRTVDVCKQHLRPADLFGRLGGEEFGILLHDCSYEQGMVIADRIRVAIGSSPLEADRCSVWISTSVGMATTLRSGYELQQLCIDADAALYRAKRAGRNRVVADPMDDSLVGA